MRKISVVKSALSVGVVATIALSLVGCSSSDDQESKECYTGGIAATVNGVEIKEDDVTSYIEGIRGQMNLSDADAWASWLVTYGYTPESVRSQVLESMIEQELIVQGAESKEITVDESEIDTYVDYMKSNYDSDEEWQNALASAGMTEDEYRNSIKQSLLASRLQDSFAVTDDPTDEEIIAAAPDVLSEYDGSKRSSHILFASTDEATAQEVLDQINAGTLDFAEAAKQYSQDNGSAADGGDVGWDADSTFVEAYQTALDELDKDQISGLVTSDYGIHIIKCTDVFTMPAEITSVSQIPEDILETIKTTVNSTKQKDALLAWFDDFKASADIQENPIPDGVGYNVDLTAAQAAADEAASDASDAAASTTSDTSDAASNEASTDASPTSSSEDEASQDGSEAATDKAA